MNTLEHNCDNKVERENLVNCLERNFESWFYKNKVPREVVFLFLKKGFRVAFIGGIFRDLVFDGVSATPRDVDIIVEGISFSDVEKIFEKNIDRKTRFGGVCVRYKNVVFDIRSLGETWGLKKKNLEPTFRNLLLTTFLNVESIVGVFENENEFSVYEKDFFKAIKKRVLDINFEENPYPELCVIRAISIAEKFDFTFSYRLAEYIVKYGEGLTLEEIRSIWFGHYRDIQFDYNKILEKIKEAKLITNY